MSTPNLLFRQARERVSSPTRPGEPLSRAELARIVSEELFHPGALRFSPINANYVGKLERGEIRCPHPRYQRAFQEALGVKSGRELGFVSQYTRSQTNVDAMQRRELLIGTGAATGLMLCGESAANVFAPRGRIELPRGIGRAHVEQIYDVARLYNRIDHGLGGGAARQLADQSLRTAARLLSVSCPGNLRADLHSAVARLAGVAGFMLFDSGQHTDARQRFAFGLHCAENGNNWHQRALLLATMARQAIHCGRVEDGLTHVETGLVRADRLTATERAMLHTVRARALACFGRCRAQETLAEIGLADEAFADSDPAEDPFWMVFYDSAQHHGDTAHALADVALSTGYPTDAADRLAFAVQNYRAEYARSRVFSRIALATLLMRGGDPGEAAEMGHRALDEAAPIQSKRTVDSLRALARAAARHEAVEEVQQMRVRIGAATATGVIG